MDVLTAHQVKSPETKSIPAASAPATASNAKPIETSLKLQPKDMEEHCEKLETTLSELQELGWNLTHNLNLDEWDPIVLKFRKIRRAMFESLEGAQQFLDQTPEVLIQRLTRATLDLGRQQGKKISIYVTGESSRIRTDLLLGMVNAFTHMVRNSVDHGIEMPDVRVAAGKPPVATLKLAFSSSGRGATIELSDDGAGLNRDKIIQTAVSKGLISHERSFELKDTEVWNLIFLPGFSTKEAVTDVSGRGVGMDVVLTAINEFSGKIDIESTAGQGTKFKVWLPSPSTTQDCLLVRADEILYALPESCTNQIVKLEKAVWIGKQSERPSIEVNKKILPVFDLIELFPLFNNGDASKIAKKSVENRAGYGVLFEKTKYPYCLKVDEIVSLENVIIKRTGNNIKKIPNVSGMTQMQNGELVYILDPEGWAEQVFNLGVGHAS